MATVESVKNKIQGLIDTANGATGNSDTDLTTAVSALVAGYGQGGSSGGYELVTGSVTLTEDTDTFRVTGLTKTPVATCVYPASPSSEFLNGTTAQIGHVWFNGLFSLKRTNTSGTSATTDTQEVFNYDNFTVYEDDYTTNTSGVYALKTGFMQYRAAYPFRAGITYNWAAIV